MILCSECQKIHQENEKKEKQKLDEKLRQIKIFSLRIKKGQNKHRTVKKESKTK